eukprot:1755644-Amphidinium_carterae.1
MRCGLLPSLEKWVVFVFQSIRTKIHMVLWEESQRFYLFKILRAHILPLTNCAFNKSGSKFVTGVVYGCLAVQLACTSNAESVVFCRCRLLSTTKVRVSGVACLAACEAPTTGRVVCGTR